jgi:hypothetical protein
MGQPNAWAKNKNPVRCSKHRTGETADPKKDKTVNTQICSEKAMQKPGALQSESPRVGAARDQGVLLFRGRNKPSIEFTLPGIMSGRLAVHTVGVWLLETLKDQDVAKFIASEVLGSLDCSFRYLDLVDALSTAREWDGGGDYVSISPTERTLASEFVISVEDAYLRAGFALHQVAEAFLGGRDRTSKKGYSLETLFNVHEAFLCAEKIAASEGADVSPGASGFTLIEEAYLQARAAFLRDQCAGIEFLKDLGQKIKITEQGRAI